jgi:hypothetical protein
MSQPNNTGKQNKKYILLFFGNKKEQEPFLKRYHEEIDVLKFPLGVSQSFLLVFPLSLSRNDGHRSNMLPPTG